MIITHVGGPTVLIEVDGWTILTDPTFDPAGGHYDFGWGTSSNKTTGPAIPVSDLPPIDAILLTHDHHGDNLDTSGRELLGTVGTVLTTIPGARRLATTGVRGLAAGQRVQLTAEGKPPISVTATPARHGPPLTRPIVGEVIGFALRRDGEDEVFLWITGDTVMYGGLRDAARGMKVDVMLVHVGGVQFPITGPLRYTMTGSQALELIRLARPRVALPVHYEGWSHFKDGRTGIERALADGKDGHRESVQWLGIGSPAAI